MVIDIEKIKIGDRIRKDFGDIEELADDIKENGLINPPTVNKDYVLLTGERRLRACKSLGWKQIEVRMMDTRDAEHELNIEISENNVRKAFSRKEEVDLMRRLFRIEQAKAKERQGERTDLPENFPGSLGDARDKTASQFGISGKQMEREFVITDNKNLLDPSDFADWDEGRLSTNKAYQMVKKRQQEIEAALRKAEQEKAEMQARVNRSQNEARTATSKANELQRQLQATKAEKETTERKLKQSQDAYRELEAAKPKETIVEVEKVVEKKVEVLPKDYEDLKSKAKLANALQQDLRKEKDKFAEQQKALLELKDELEELKWSTAQGQSTENIATNIYSFCTLCYNFIGNVGGLVWLTDKIADMPEKEKEMFLKAAYAFRDWALVFTQNLERSTGNGE